MPYGTIKVDTITFTSGSSDVSIPISGLVQNPTFTGNVTVTGTISGTTVRGNTVSGATVTGTAGQFGTLTGNTAGFTTVTGTTVTGTTANFGGTITATSGVFASGTAAAPSISVGATDNGLYSPGTDEVAISTNGTGRLFVDNSGRILIGTSSATGDQLLIVQGYTGISVGNAEFGLRRGGNPTVADQGLGAITFQNNSGNNGARIEANSAGAWTSGSSHPTYLAFSTTASGSSSASERLRITSDGKVGLGTSSPGEKLSISSGNIFVDNGNIQLYKSIGYNSSADISLITGINDAAVNNNKAYQYKINLAGDAGGQKLTFVSDRRSATSLSCLTIDGSSGSVGIGTTAATERLSINDSGANAAISIRTGGASFNSVVKFNADDTNYAGIGLENTALVMRCSNSSTPTERARIDSSGRLLVGTSNNAGPLTKSIQLHSAGTGTSQPGYLVVSYPGTTNDQNGYFEFYRSAASTLDTNTLVGADDRLGMIGWSGANGSGWDRAAAIYAEIDGTPGASDMPGRLVFATTPDGSSSPQERMRINNSGEVLTNCTALSGDAPNNQGGRYLQINGNEKIRGASTSGSSPDTLFQFYHGTKTTSDGSITVSTTATAYNTSSDYRLKENVTPIFNAIQRVQQLKPSRFNFINEPAHVVDGFLAHEAQAVVPECVTGTKDEVNADGNPVYQGIDQSKLVPLLTAALQEALAKIETLEAKVAALEAS